MDAFELLKTDHRKVSDLFDQIEPTTDRDAAARRELFSRLKTELDVHAHVEETILYPRLKQAAETKEITTHAYEEHQEVKDLLKEIQSMPPDGEKWMEKVRELRKNVEHHIREEENKMFSEAREVLSGQEVEEIGDRLHEEKQRQLKQMSAAAG